LIKPSGVDLIGIQRAKEQGFIHTIREIASDGCADVMGIPHPGPNVSVKDAHVIAQHPEIILPKPTQGVLEVSIWISVGGSGVAGKVENIVGPKIFCSWGELSVSWAADAVSAIIMISAGDGVTVGY
jgi:hypothetical protein